MYKTRVYKTSQLSDRKIGQVFKMIRMYAIEI